MLELYGSKYIEIPQPLSPTKNKTIEHRFELARVLVCLLHASWRELSRFRNSWGPLIPEA